MQRRLTAPDGTVRLDRFKTGNLAVEKTFAIRTPFKRHRRRPRLSRREKAVNRSHAKIRAVGERAIATVKCWKLLTKLHCCPKRATALLAAILVLQLVEEQRH